MIKIMNSKPVPSTTATTGERLGAVLVVTCIALGAVVSAMSSLNVAIPSIAQATHASQTQLAWIIDAYSLVFAALLLPGGAIGDRFGRRKALLAGLTIFGAASALAMTTTSPTMLIGLRGVIGIGAAMVMPATLSTITTTFPAERRAQAVGVWAAVAGGGAIIGLLASGAVLSWWSWRAVFAINVVLTAIAIAGTLSFVPESADPDAPRIDSVGAGIAVIGLTSLVYSIIEAPNRGWASAATIGGILISVVVLAGFVRWELRVESPLLDPRLFRKPSFAAGTLTIFLAFFGFFGFIFVVMQYLQLVRGDSAMVAAVSVIPMAATLIPSARIAPSVVDRIGTRGCCTLGLLLAAAGMSLLATMGQGTPYWRFFIGLIPLGAGMGLAMTPATTAVTNSLPPSLQGVGSAVNDLSREVGGALGIAVLGSLLTAVYSSRLDLPGTPAPEAEAAKHSLGVAAHLGGPVLTHAQAAFVDGMHVALFGAAGVAVVAAGVVSGLLRHDGRPVTATAAHELEPIGA
jgi:EmrB/QacA subfamily drug resistance transporter